MEYNAFTAEEVQKLLAVGGKIADSAIIMLYTGMRVSEMLDVKCSDIDLAAKTICVYSKKDGKRVLPIPDVLLPIIERNMGNKYLVDEMYGRYNTKFRILMKELELNHTPYECRHTFLQKCHQNGIAEGVNMR